MIATKMKRRLAIICIAPTALILAACGSTGENTAEAAGMTAATSAGAAHENGHGVAAATTTTSQAPEHEHDDNAKDPAGPFVGDPLHVGVNGAAARITVTNLYPASFPPGSTAPSGNTWEADIAIEEIYGSWSVNSQDFYVRTTEGHRIPATSGLAIGELSTGIVSQGQAARGKIAFLIPTGQRASSITVALPYGAQLATWSVR
ncbi:hypothetical protein XU06_31845 (plasmid) [Rhodococcus erythropolis]|uniref:DUF1942 domain-containing protein n=1 Tax=Rhodococcus erythropolis TaxID=1833 RepID=UPI00061B7550|nr:DUF1942 domain-containing protein [Rhodococcus erythropolis]AKE01510.1 hypothetical protein XU06_31845 [Rhodococcus erythropolis]